MRDVHEAMAALRASIGISDIGFERFDHFDLIVDDRLTVDFHRVGDTAIEIAAVVAAPSAVPDAAVLRARLVANHLGRETGAARFARDPRDGSAILCRRIEVGPCDDRAFVASVLDFIRRALAVSQARGPAPVRSDRPSSYDETEFRIRI